MSPTLMAVTSGISFRQRLDDLGFALRVGAFRQFERGQHAVGRAFERVGREHHDEVDGERFPIDLAQRSDGGFDIAAENVHGDGVAELQPQSLGEIDVERHERRSGVAFGPPFALGDGRSPRHGVGIGQAAVAGQHPARIGRGLDLLHRNPLERHDPSSQHRRVVELGGRFDRPHLVLEGFEVGGFDVEEIIGGRVDCDIALDLGEQRAVDQRHGDEQPEAETEGDRDRARQRAGAGNAGERQRKRRRLGAAKLRRVALQQQAEPGEQDKGSDDAGRDRGGDGALLGGGDGECE